MTETVKLCFTCRTSDCKKFYKAHSCDTDKMTYLDKLKTCIGADLIENDDMEMCSLCVKNLRISYKFRLTVLMSQECLKKSEFENLSKCDNFSEIASNNEASSDLKNDSDDDSVKSENYFSDDSLVLDSVKTRRKRKRKQKSDEILTCEFCAAQFSKNWQLRKHLARVHNEIRKYVCSYCGKEFKQAYHLKEHITSHTGEKNYTCPICDKKFQRQSSQRRHIKSHDAPPGHKTKRTPFLCTICGKSFPFSNGVQRHMRIHLGIKNFECKLCNRRFTQSTHLQVHMRTHTGEKPYICDTCGEKFSLKSCLLKHINNRHYRSKTLVEDLPIFYLPKDFDNTDMKEFENGDIKDLEQIYVKDLEQTALKTTDML